jgi:hypothetical protein
MLAKEQDVVQRFKQVVGKAVMPNNQKCPFPKGIQSMNKLNTYDYKGDTLKNIQKECSTFKPENPMHVQKHVDSSLKLDAQTMNKAFHTNKHGVGENAN